MDLIGETQSLISEMKRMSLGRSEFGPYVRAANEDFYLAQIRTVTKELNNATKRTSFSRSSSGPYTSNLHRVLNEMVGRFPRDFTNADVAGRAPGSLQQAQNALKSAENALRAHKFWPESSRK
jgi:hypothetical protein